MSRPSWWYAPLLHSLKERKWNTVYIGAIESLSEKPKRQKMPNYVALLENPYICRLYRYRHENRKIMVEKPITKNITLDTSYIESNNFLAGNALNRLSELVKKHSIKLYLTDITYREIIARFNKRIESTKGTVKQIEKSAKKEFYILKNTVSMKPYFELPTIDIRVLEEEFISNLKQWIDNNNVQIISSRDISCGEIFDDYFNGNPPFGIREEKKHEFPDAFSIRATVDYFSRKGQKTYLLSTDGDFLATKEETLIPTNKEASVKLIDLIIRHSTKRKEKIALAFIESKFEAERSSIVESVIEKIEEHIEEVINNSIFIGNSVEVDGAENVDVSNLEINNHSISNLDIDSGSAGLECEVTFDFEADYAVEDYSEAFYDKEDGVFYNLINESRTISRSEKIYIDLKVEYKEAEDYCEFEIESINEGNDIDVFGLPSEY